MSDPTLVQMRDLIQHDIGNRGLRTDPDENLITVCADDFVAACRSIADHPAPAIGIVTGFYIPHAQPPCGETDGPLGAVFLARALVPLGIKVVVLTDGFCIAAVEAGLALAGLRKMVLSVLLPDTQAFEALSPQSYWETVAEIMRLTGACRMETERFVQAQQACLPTNEPPKRQGR